MEGDVDLNAYAYDRKEFMDTWYTHNEYKLFAPINRKEGYLLIDQIWVHKIE